MPKNKHSERKKFNRLIKKVFGVLESGEFRIIFKKSSKARGYFISDNKIIVLDPRDDILLTLIHECLHALFAERKIKSLEGENEEKTVINLEKFCKRHITSVEAIYLTKLLFVYLVDENI